MIEFLMPTDTKEVKPGVAKPLPHVRATNFWRFASFDRRPGGSFRIGSMAVLAIAASISLRISVLEGCERGAVFCFVTFGLASYLKQSSPCSVLLVVQE